MATLTSRQLKSTYEDRRPPVQSARYRDNVYYQNGLLVIGVLATLLYLLVAISLDAAGYADNMAILFPVTFGAVLLGILMSFSHFDGFFALSHSLFTSFAWILFLMSRQVTITQIQPILDNGIPAQQARAYFVLLQWVDWVRAAVTSQPVEDNFIFVFEISFLVWWLTFLGIWSIFRYGYAWRAIVPAGIVLAINTYYAPESVLIFMVIFSMVALVLLVRTNLAEQQLRWREQRIHFSQDIAFEFVRSALYLSAAVLIIAWVAPGLGSNPSVLRVTRPVRTAWQDFGEGLNELYPSLNRQQVGVSSFGTSLTLSGAREVGDRPVFQVETPFGRYWRAVTYDTYNGRSWENTVNRKAGYDEGELIPTTDWSNREVITQTITLLMPTGNVIFSPPDMRQIDVPLDALVQPMSGTPLPSADGTTSENEPVEITYARSSRKLEAYDSYTVISNYASVTENALRSASTDYPPQIIEKYLQLPDDFSTRVAETARQVAADQETVYDKTKTLETFLRGYTYNDAIAAPPEGADPVEYFLYDIQQGYCDYYATAMAVMLRSLDIPARTVSGYAEGQEAEEGGLFFVNERDAHTWVEVYFPGNGWIEFEPTAGESVLTRQSGDDSMAAMDSAAAAGGEFPESNSFDDGANQFPEGGSNLDAGNIPEDEPFFGALEGTPIDPRSRWLWVVLTPLLLIIGLIGLWRMRVSVPDAFSPDAAPILYDRMIRWAERIGVWFGSGHTPYEHADQLSRSLPGGKPYIEEITDEYVHYRFSGKMKGMDDIPENGVEGEGFQSKTVDSWKALQPLLMKEWLRRRTHRKKKGKKGDKPDAYSLK